MIKSAVPIELDKTRHLLLDLNAMVSFQDETGYNLLDDKDTKKLMTAAGPKEVRALLWACLIHEDETLTLKQVGSWLHTGNMAEVTEKLTTAWTAAMPKGGEKETDPLVKRRKRRSG